MAGDKVGIVQLMGRVSMPTLDCPFRIGWSEVQALKQETATIVVDMHAEATSEKMAMGWYLDGEVSGVFGTHTRSEEHTSELQSRVDLVCRLLLEKKNT